MRLTYIVVKSGVYIQNIYGPFSKVADARRAGNRLAKREGGDYHTFSVRRLLKGEGIRTHVFGTFRGKPRIGPARGVRGLA